MIVTSTMHLPRYVSDMVGACPRAGEGVHSWLFRCARVLHPHRKEDEIISLLVAASHGCGREVPINEISEAVRNSKQCAPQIGQRCLTRANKLKKWPSQNSDAIATISGGGHGLADLWELSPCRIEDNLPRTEHIIDELFSDNPLLCVGKSIKHFDTRPREQWRGALHALQLIVPNHHHPHLNNIQTSFHYHHMYLHSPYCYIFHHPNSWH